jgi:hypothetical protein
VQFARLGSRLGGRWSIGVTEGMGVEQEMEEPSGAGRGWGVRDLKGQDGMGRGVGVELGVITDMDGTWLDGISTLARLAWL